jgi:hypothetical protein
MHDVQTLVALAGVAVYLRVTIGLAQLRFQHRGLPGTGCVPPCPICPSPAWMVVS